MLLSEFRDLRLMDSEIEGGLGVGCVTFRVHGLVIRSQGFRFQIDRCGDASVKVSVLQVCGHVYPAKEKKAGRTELAGHSRI